MGYLEVVVTVVSLVWGTCGRKTGQASRSETQVNHEWLRKSSGKSHPNEASSSYKKNLAPKPPFLKHVVFVDFQQPCYGLSNPLVHKNHQWVKKKSFPAGPSPPSTNSGFPLCKGAFSPGCRLFQPGPKTSANQTEPHKPRKGNLHLFVLLAGVTMVVFQFGQLVAKKKETEPPPTPQKICQS